MNKKQYFIYLTTNLINNKQYIGMHYGFPNDTYLGSGSLILKAIKYYGKQNFKREILEFCPDKLTAQEREKFWIAKYNAVDNEMFYNLTEGGELNGSWIEVKKWREKNPELAKQHDEKAVQKLREWEQKHPEGRQKNTKILLDAAHQWQKTHPKEVENQMKKVNQAKEKWQQEHPEEHQAQVNAWRQAGSIANSKKVHCITTDEYFDSISAAARAYACYGCIQGNISKALKGERKSCGKKDGKKLFWEFV